MGLKEIEGGGKLSTLVALMAVAIAMAVNPYVGFAMLPMTVLAIAIPQIPQLQFGNNPFAGFLEGKFGRAGRHIKERYGQHYAGAYAVGKCGAVEAMVFIAYVFCTGMLTGLIGVDIGTDLKTIAVVGVVVTGIILLAQKAYLKFTALEMVTFAIAIALPIMASGLISQIALPAEWLSDAWHKIAIWGISCVSCVIMAFQD